MDGQGDPETGKAQAIDTEALLVVLERRGLVARGEMGEEIRRVKEKIPQPR